MENEKQRKERIRQMRISKGERNGFNPLQASVCLQKTEMRLQPLVAAFGWGVDELLLRVDEQASNGT
ncbi:hypothetical protein INR49_032928 [Caranx melampygus]|nr:hypothetical protein INR49_032928 [Caranx melampygus]